MPFDWKSNLVEAAWVAGTSVAIQMTGLDTMVGTGIVEAIEKTGGASILPASAFRYIFVGTTVFLADFTYSGILYWMKNRK
jgi:hypothetical protein